MPKTNSLDTNKIEKKWQDIWNKKGTYTPDIEKISLGKTRDASTFYNLWMWPYPSAEGLHAGHAFASTGSDIYGRFMRMHGKTVFQPIGYDSFGIHSENYAIKINQNPHEVVKRTTKYYEKQLRSLGHGYDWTRTPAASDPSYYKWTQWLFVQMFKAGLAYRKTAEVNWCPSCKTVLSDEQVVNGVCERCQTMVEKKDLEQWFFRITKYADRLLRGLGKIDWSQRVVTAQQNWIGKSEGMIINFKTEGGGYLPVFTTRPDTLNAATFIVVADEKLYNEKSSEKIGEFTEKYAIDPLSGRKLPIWKTNYVAPGYGTGNVMGVPAHDERDMKFAKKYHLDVIKKAPDEKLWSEIETKGWGKKHTNYHLRDWLVSRQRYWGTPIPMIDCPKCGWVPVPEKDLPVLLPTISDYKPEGQGKGPLANHPDFYEVDCPKCGVKARRETDVMDTFVDSSWYFLAYPNIGTKEWKSVPSAGSGQAFFDEKIMKAWLPVDLYFGGAEHAVLHLMYARFVTMVLHDQKLLDFDEPFPKFFAHGLMIKDGAKMSKSRGNVVNPDEYIAKFGADTLRLYLMFMGPMDGYPDFRDTGIEGMARFVNRLWRAFNGYVSDQKTSSILTTKLHQTIKKVTKDIECFGYNTAISSIMEFLNNWEDEKKLNKEDAMLLIKIIAPFAPHLAEEVWVEVLGQPFSVHISAWPSFDPALIKEDNITIVVQVNGKLRGQLDIAVADAGNQAKVEEKAKSLPAVAAWLAKSSLKKIVFVPEKVINFVVG